PVPPGPPVARPTICDASAARALGFGRDSPQVYRFARLLTRRTRTESEPSLSAHEAGPGLFSRCPRADPVHPTRDTSRAVPAHICNGNAGLEHTKALVRNPLCKAGGLSFDVL